MNLPQVDASLHNLRSTDVELAHLLRTQLNIILGHTQLLSFNPHLDLDGRNQINEINSACQVILDCAEGLLKSCSTQAAPDSATTPPTFPPLLLPGHRILIVEDNPANRALLKMQLDNLGYEADLVTSAEEALHLWLGGGYGLILTDLHLPGSSGLDLTLNIRMLEQEREWPYIPIVALTAASEEECWQACRQVGMDALLSKPVTMEKLCQLLRNYCLSFADEPVQPVVSLSAAILRDIYRQSARELLIASQSDLICRNRAKLAGHMHTLKSSSASAGASAVARQAELLEHCSRHANWNDLALALGELHDLFENFCQHDASSSVSTVPAVPNITATMIQQAIDGDAFSLDYIPYADAHTLLPVGVQIRFGSRKTGWEAVPTEVILFLVERFGLFGALSEQLMTRALLTVESLQQAGHTLRLTFPVSSYWLECSRLPDFIRASLKVTRVPPENLSLEVGAVLCQRAASRLSGLCREGVGLSLDDLMRSHYTLAQLREMGYTQTRFSLRSAGDHSLTEIPKRTGLMRIVTGVANRQDLDQARLLGADFVQGPLIGQVLPEESLADWLNTRV